MLSPASILIKIQPGIDYSTDSIHNSIFSIHCTKTNTCPVKITTYIGSEVEFPPYSFINGAVYHIFVKKIEFEEDKAGFIGYKSASLD